MKSVFLTIFVFTSSLFSAQENATQTAQQFQYELNRSFADKEKSPLMEEDYKTFTHLEFFPVTNEFIIKAKFIRTRKEKSFKMKTTTERLPVYKKYGELHFTFEGKEYKLNVYQNLDLIKKDGYEDYLFLPFSDTTNGNETYIGGRYIDCRIQKELEWTIDFNKAYNPYCAYHYKYSCPIVPMENDLPIAIIAGVKKFHD
ncbi:DUF1684 domain-containing protein [Flavobacterium sp.]|uniref:DUF1684 domain-containing protein n=1 Tax=Flavobacterium sp. TaxID=239 RepID=UPI0022CC6E7E|nr:DUF1684 domain-containing protein [Flavobacterium sp.]MCZ8089882.1 DUF1684 domain-containing protein [Flavobacterium sp.]